MAARCPGQTQDPGRRDVLSQMSTTEVLPCPILSPTPPCSPHPNETVLFVSGLLAAERRRRGTRRGRRALGCYRQAVLILRWFIDGTRLAQLAADNAISASTAYRNLHEGIDVLAAVAPGLRARCWPRAPPAMRTSRWTAR